MQPEILEAFEYQGQTLFIRLEEDASDQDWLIVRAHYADGRPFNKFIYSVYQKDRMRSLSNGEEDPIKEFVRSVHFDIESEAQQKLERALRGEWVH